MPIPPQAALRAILAGTSEPIRRIEIYEEDGLTRWVDDIQDRVTDGSVSVDYSRDERRALSLTLDNSDKAILTGPKGFWYDKIIKVFRGVHVNEPKRAPRILVVGDTGGTRYNVFRDNAYNVGYGVIRYKPTVTTLDELVGYDILVSIGGTSTVNNIPLLVQAYDAGYRIFTAGNTNAYTNLPWATAHTSIASGVITSTPKTSLAHPLTQGWTAITGQVGTRNQYTLRSSAFFISDESTALAEVNPNGNGGRWVHIAGYNSSKPAEAFTKTVFEWLDPVEAIVDWEVQCGEFMIDRISEPNFPHTITVTGRDYTKKCMLSTFLQATAFTAGDPVEGTIKAIAQAASVTKFRIPPNSKTLGDNYMFERGTTRWEAIKQIATSFNYEIFFDATGYLVVRDFLDPVSSPISVQFEAGPEVGNLVSYEKSANDNQIRNSVLVTGESSNAEIEPVWAVAKNTRADSPTSIANLGSERVYTYSSAFITTTAQALALARQFLAVRALEEFELTMESIVFAWLEVGEIARFVDPVVELRGQDPDMFLLTSLTIPMKLGTMSAVGKRITVVI